MIYLEELMRASRAQEIEREIEPRPRANGWVQGAREIPISYHAMGYADGTKYQETIARGENVKGSAKHEL